MTDLAAAARFEIASREKHWPARVAAGDMVQSEAEADIAAWRAIEQLLAHRTVETELAFANLVAAAQRAIDSRATKRPSPANEERIGALTTIRRRLIGSAHAAGTFAWHHERRAA